MVVMVLDYVGQQHSLWCQTEPDCSIFRVNLKAVQLLCTSGKHTYTHTNRFLQVKKKKKEKGSEGGSERERDRRESVHVHASR